MRYVFRLPDVGEGTTEAEIVKWHVAPGTVVREDDPLVDLATDKAVVEIPSPASGTVVSLGAAPGDSLPVGAELAVIESGVAADAPAGSRDASAPSDVASVSSTQVVQTVPPVVAVPASATEPARRAGLVFASPSVRRHARELGIDIGTLAGSGPGGRVVHADLTMPGKAIAAPAADTGEIETVRILGVRRKIAQHLQESARRIPHFSYVEEIDMTELESLRRHLNERHPDRPRLTLLPFLIRAMTRALRAHPDLNARFDDEAGTLARYRAVHVGIATQTPNGLMVPVLRDAGQLDLWACAAGIASLAAAAREGRATRDMLSGSTITVTSLGALGGIATTPLINHPETAIIGVNRLEPRPVVREGAIVVRTMMNLSSSFDHRIVDGWHAAEFIGAIRSQLEHPATLYID